MKLWVGDLNACSALRAYGDGQPDWLALQLVECGQNLWLVDRMIAAHLMEKFSKRIVNLWTRFSQECQQHQQQVVEPIKLKH